MKRHRNLPPLDAIQLRDEFMNNTQTYVGKLRGFVGESAVVVYGFADDPASGQYTAYLNMLFPGSAHPHTINLSRQPNGGLEGADIQGKKVIVCSDQLDPRYSEFLGRRFGKLEDQGYVVLSEDVRYIVARPDYEIRPIKRPLPDDTGNGNDNGNGKEGSKIIIASL